VRCEAVIHTLSGRGLCRTPASYMSGEETLMIYRVVAALIAGLCLAVSTWPGGADEGTPESEEGRYTFHKIADGFVRLDMQTGEVSTCSQRTVGWACQAVPEDRAVLEREITRLRAENALLKRDLISRGLPLPTGTMPEPPIAREDHRGLHRGDSELDRMMAFMGRVWQRLVEAIAQAQKQVLNKS
jgi:hypothetical protein